MNLILYLRNTRATGIRGKGSNQRHCKEGEEQSPAHIHQIVNDVSKGPFVDANHELGPALPLRTLVSLLECGLVGVPAAVFMVEPEANETYSFLEVGHPVSRDVDPTSQSTFTTNKAEWNCEDSLIKSFTIIKAV